MNILLFGGNSQRNKQWIHEVGDILSSDFDMCITHDYEHWDERGEFINFDAELAKLDSETKGLNPYIIFAKSVGSILTLKAIAAGLLKPSKCIFAGLPIKLAEEDAIPLPDLLKKNVIPTLILQNSEDPVASFSRLNEYLKQLSVDNVTTIELVGSTHSYDDLERLKDTIISFAYQT